MRNFLFVFVGLLLTSGAAYAATESSFAASTAATVAEEGKTKPSDGPSYYITVLTIGFSLTLAAFAGAFGQSRAISAAVESIARQPEAGGRIFLSMIIGLALIETLVIYTLLIGFLLLGKLA